MTEASTVDPGAGGKAGRLPLAMRLLANLVVLGLSTTIALGAAEIAVRVVAPQQLIMIRPDIWQAADSLGWRHSPNLETQVNTGERRVTLYTDEEGFRVGRRGRREAADSILLIGDSFMAALQVEHYQSLAGLMEDTLRGPERQTVSVRNSGVGSWGPSQYLIFGRQRLVNHQYGLALVAIFTGNDLVRERQEYIEKFPRGERRRFRVPFSFSPEVWIESVARPINDALESRSHLFVFLKARLEPLRIRLGLSVAYVPRGLLKARADGPEWDVTADILADLASVADSVAVPILFVLIPAEYQVDERLFASHAAAFGVDQSAVDLDQPNVRLRGEMDARGLAVVDALPAFRDAARNGTDLYGAVDSHLSPSGHWVLFRLLREELEARMRWTSPSGS